MHNGASPKIVEMVQFRPKIWKNWNQNESKIGMEMCINYCTPWCMMTICIALLSTCPLLPRTVCTCIGWVENLVAACGRTCPYKTHGRDLHTYMRTVGSEQRGRYRVSTEDSRE